MLKDNKIFMKFQSKYLQTDNVTFLTILHFIKNINIKKDI